MNIFERIKDSIEANFEQNAFFCNGNYYRYIEFAQAISNIRNEIKKNISTHERILGVITNDDIETYASIFALWLEGKAYVPINKELPKDRINSIITQASISTILDSSKEPSFKEYRNLKTISLENVSINLNPVAVENSELAYLLFTSGTTGLPKGVPITRSNLTSFVEAFEKLEIKIYNNDRCLQMFDLTFDLSVMSYLIPILNGACVYTIPKDKIKYSYIFELIDDYKITVALMVPSILNYLRPYFDEINSESMRYSLFCGEALSINLTSDWSKCIPNAKILNVYGPTENTIFCTSYLFDRNNENKAHNGIMCIEKPMMGVNTYIVDDKNNILDANNKGELCLAGNLLTPGYWNNEEKNKTSFIYSEIKGEKQRLYRTGDYCYIDEQGDIFSLGRIDSQVQIQGYRVELSEIDHFVRTYCKGINTVTIAFENEIGNTDLALFFESEPFDTADLNSYLKGKLPTYMIPTKTLFIKPFPLNSNGKTDRKALGNLILFKK